MTYEYKFYDRLCYEIQNFAFENLDLISIVSDLKKIYNQKQLQTWIDVRNGVISTDEEEPEDKDTHVPIDYDYQLIKFFDTRCDFVIDKCLDNIFYNFNSRIKDVDGVEYVHIHNMKNFLHPTHKDGNLVLIFNLSCPEDQDTKTYGLMIENEIYQPKKNEVTWLETNLYHSAWNYSNIEWKFLTVSLDRNYIKG